MQKQKKESDEITEKGVSKKGLQSGDTNKRKIKLKIINLKKGADSELVSGGGHVRISRQQLGLHM